MSDSTASASLLNLRRVFLGMAEYIARAVSVSPVPPLRGSARGGVPLLAEARVVGWRMRPPAPATGAGRRGFAALAGRRRDAWDTAEALLWRPRARLRADRGQH